jgi:hypothetical protein
VTINVLWADDDCDRNIEPLGWLLEEKGDFIILKARNYKEAIKHLENGEEDESVRVQALLLDIILPHSEGGGALTRYLGLTLADRAANHGVKAIVFLTVVLNSEVKPYYDELKKRFPYINFHYENKADLLEFHKIEALVRYLSEVNGPMPH